MTWRAGRAVCLGLLVLSAGCGRQAPRAPRPDQEMDFAGLFRRNCQGCHGADGKTGPAPPLNDPLFRALVSEEFLRHIIREGREGTLMPAFAHEAGGLLSDGQIDVLAKGIHSRDVWGEPAKPDGLPPYREKSPGDRDQGEKVFARTCANCHGAGGKGGRAGRLNDPSLLSLLSGQALRRLIITGRPDLAEPGSGGGRGLVMPSFRDYPAGPLTDQDVADIVAYVSAWKQESRPDPNVAAQQP